MYVIMVYDVGEERVGRMVKIGRKYLTWVQNSVFEGEITRSNMLRLKHEIEVNMDREYDSITFYIISNYRYLKKEVIGREKGTPESIL